MSTSKYVDAICIAGIVIALAIVVAALFAAQSGLTASANDGKDMEYEQTLFDDSIVHTLSIQIEDWEGFLDTCEDEEYVPCNVVIDSEEVQVVGLRAKGNTSLSTVSSLGSDRYSFKLEFDQYTEGGNFHGLDKLSLNNVIQDSTYMKDYLTYTLMNKFGVDAPLCSYIYITVNGEDWGLYLAVEGVEESFLERNYGSDFGHLYKPDSMSFGGGRGNGEGFEMDKFQNEDGSFDFSKMPDAGNVGGPQMQNPPEGFSGFDGSNPPEGFGGSGAPEGFDGSGASGGFGGPNMPGGFGMGANDVKLQYIDDNPSSYSNIFDNAKTSVNAADKSRLIASLKNISEGSDLENSIDIEEVIRYFVVHNYVCNSDSYTGSMTHNYYLYEKDGTLSMIPWDYNLAFGTFMANDASGMVNDAIDSPLQASGDGSLPMFDFIVKYGYLEMYHEYFEKFLDNVDVEGIIQQTEQLIAPYVQKDPTAFYSYEEHLEGVEALTSFCKLRTQSVKAQLNGSIPSSDSERTDETQLVDTSGLNLSAMGSMGRDNRGDSNGGGFTPDKGSSSGERFTPPGNGFSPGGGFSPSSNGSSGSSGSASNGSRSM